MRWSALAFALALSSASAPPPESASAPVVVRGREADPPLPAAADPGAPVAAVVAPLAGPAYDDDAALPAHADDVADYTLRATLDPEAHTVHGEGTITWRNTSTQPARELWLHLYLNAFKNERSAFFRERVGGRGSAPPEDWGWIDVRKLVLRAGDSAPVDVWPTAELHRPGDDDETDARVPLPRTIEPGEAVQLDVVFDDKLPIVVERTGYRRHYHMVGQWFPKVARLEADGTWAHFPFHHLAEFYADYGTYDVTLDVPQAYTLGATGPLVEWHVADGRRVERHVQSDVHDFAWTAWDAWQTARENIDGIDVTLLYPRGFKRMAQRELATLRFALPYYSKHYGRYPYKVLTVVHPQQDAGESGGMEYPTLITTGSSWMTPPGLLAPEIVTIHEMGHQWFYGLVGTNELAWPFLDEGINQFAEQDGMAKWRGEGSALDFAGLTVSDASVDAMGGDFGVHDEPVAQPANAFTTGANYGELVYDRTASVMETLRRVYGDEPVLRALGRYARRYRFEHPGPEELLAVFEEVLGAHVAATLRTAFFEKGWVDYVVDGVWANPATRAAGMFDRDGQRERVEHDDRAGKDWDNSVLVRRRGTLSFPVDVDLVLADGTTRHEHWDGEGESRRFSWHGTSAVRAAVVDPQDRVMVDMNLENNRGAAEGRGGGAGSTLERATYWMQLALQAVAP
ncbi:MAG TPA: M1 family aminopeptidase [Polyangiaceae bacterium]